MTKYLRPKFFLAGTLLGFILCCLSGYLISNKARLHHFSRFFLEIEPQTLYYPTASELLQTAKHDLSDDKILVLIGGSSIFRGVGQDPDELWSNHLQKLLGDRFKVENFASDGASFSSYGGVLFRMLRKSHPKMIFVASSYQFNSEGYMDGLQPYDYLFWDAYYKNLFQPYDKETALIKQLRKNQMTTAGGIEQHVMNYLDSYFYSRNLWNWMSYRLVFTMFSEFTFRKPFQPRRKFHDETIPADYTKLLLKTYNDSEHLNKFKEFLTQTAAYYVTDINKSPLQILPSVAAGGLQGYDEVFQPIDRSKILMVQTTYNTHIMSLLPRKIQNAYWFANTQSHIMMKSLGYNVIDVGQDFTGDDYMDIDHFRATGGRKLSLQVAAEVKHIAEAHKWIVNSQYKVN
ncbi:MAG: hypothetical protein P4M12_05400 [Gammaproteobacteria bacterium]|nr:hypothetical protein [Gammaproteobacteria bacterium]